MRPMFKLPNGDTLNKMKDFQINGVTWGSNVLVRPAEDLFASFGILTYIDDDNTPVPEGSIATAWESERVVDECYVQRIATAWETQTPCPRMTLTVAEFMQRFTSIEFQSYALSTDPEIAVLRVEVSTYTDIDLDSPRLSDGLDLLISKGIIAAERKVELMAQE